MRYRYSRWDGAQTDVGYDADDLLQCFADDLLAGTDPESLLQRALQRGVANDDREPLPGLRDLVRDLDAAVDRELADVDIDTVLDDIITKLAEIEEIERREGLGDEGVTSTLPPPIEAPRVPIQDPLIEEQQPDQPAGSTGSADEKDRQDNPAMGSDCGGAGGEGSRDRGDGQGGAPSPKPREGDVRDEQRAPGNAEPPPREPASQAKPADKRTVKSMLSRFSSRRRSYLGGPPVTPAAQFAAFAGYNFVNPEAWERFRRLQSRLNDLLGDPYLCEREGVMPPMLMIDASNEAGEGAANIASVDSEVPPETRTPAEPHHQVAILESLLASLTPAVREQVEQLRSAVLRDTLSEAEIARLQAAMRTDDGMRQPRSYRFTGQRAIDLDGALDLIDRLHRLQRLRTELASTTPSRLDTLDLEAVRLLLGEDAYGTLRALREMCEALERAGYLEWRGTRLVLTTRGIRKLGDRAAHDIFASLQRDIVGHHVTKTVGAGFDRWDEYKAYEFGDPFIINVEETVRNSLIRSGARSPVHLDRDDFVVYQHEAAVRAATVLMLDLSRSMMIRSCFAAARRVALALRSLILECYPRDTLYVLGFSDRARELTLDTLPRISLDDHATNMQDGFRLAQRLLCRHVAANRQIILITDGEPTAHLDGDRLEFSYPPSQETRDATLYEARRCAQERITINTFMLEREHDLTDFVHQMTRINRGRAFFTAPERLGDYVLADYVANRR